jgi:hypothetical protein
MSKRRDRNAKQDSLDLIRSEDCLLESLFAEWDHGAPDSDTSNEDAVVRAWKRGTIGKLILEHAALRLAAKADVMFCLQRGGRTEMAGAFGQHATEARRVIDQLDRYSRGVTALDLRYSDEFGDGIENLRRIWRGELRSESEYSLDHVATILGTNRSQLRTARFVKKHAPVHPALRARWYHRIALVLRLHALYDRFRGLPTSESGTFSDRRLAQQYDADG